MPLLLKPAKNGTASKEVQKIMRSDCSDFAAMGYERIGDCQFRPTFPPLPTIAVPETLPPFTFPPYSPKPSPDDNIFQAVVGWIGKGVEYFTGGINGELFRLLFTGLLVVAVWKFIKRWKQRRNRE